MTSRYRVEYALKAHKRDELIEWIKSLLAVPFVLHADIENHQQDVSKLYANDNHHYLEEHDGWLERNCETRYLEVFEDVEKLVDNTRALDALQGDESLLRSRLRQLVPSVGRFFTRLPLKDAFLIEDAKRRISKRRLVSPSFNDVRAILNTAQAMALAKTGLKLITFDGDVTLYEDGKDLTVDLPIVDCLVGLLERGLFVAVVTAAGYPGAHGATEYHRRLHGLIERLRYCDLTPEQKSNFLVMGGELNYLFRYLSEKEGLVFIEGDDWYLPLMRSWDPVKLAEIMDVLHHHLDYLRRKFRLDDDAKTTIIRKERSLGIIPVNGYKIARETLEEIVLLLLEKLNWLLRQRLQNMAGFRRNSGDEHITVEADFSDIRVCAFNGGSDVWVDIGDKALGVNALQAYLCRDAGNSVCPIERSQSLHIGDQFASVGANDFKARLSACTVWIASPHETLEILQFLQQRLAAA